MIKQLEQQVKDVIRYSQGIDEPKVEEILEKWKKNKQKFIDLFGGKLIYECPIKESFELESKIKTSKVLDFADLCATRFDNYELCRFIEHMADNFYSNVTLCDYHMANDLIIPKGMKIIKAFKYFEKNKEVLEVLQNQASRLIQEDKISGTLCLSVHPLDFLSSSENAHNWRSCHALDGDFRVGNLSYMCDTSTIICYLKADEEASLANFPFEWNSKKWRMLVHFSNDFKMMFAGRQYPFNSMGGLCAVQRELNSLGGNWSNWDNSTIDNLYKVGEYKISKEDLIIDKNRLHYNDLLYSSTYKNPYYSFNEEGAFQETTFYIGENIPCLKCGGEYLEDGSSFMCLDCMDGVYEDNFEYCEICGARIPIGEGHYVDHLMICDYCFDEEYCICDNCGDIVSNSLIVYDRETDRYICKECMREKGGEEIDG